MAKRNSALSLIRNRDDAFLVIAQARGLRKAGRSKEGWQMLEDMVMELAQALTRASATREAQMIALGLRIGDGGLLVGREVEPAVAEAWRKVVFFAHKAKDANDLNGAIVNAHLEFTQEAIQVLRQGGMAPNEMYGRDGKSQAAASGVSLAAG